MRTRNADLETQNVDLKTEVGELRTQAAERDGKLTEQATDIGALKDTAGKHEAASAGSLRPSSMTGPFANAALRTT